MDTLPVREQQLTALSRDYEIAKANYKSLLDKRIAADMATDLERRQQGERFTMIDPAQPPAKPFSPDRVPWAALGCALGLLIAVIARRGARNEAQCAVGRMGIAAGRRHPGPHHAHRARHRSAGI